MSESTHLLYLLYFGNVVGVSSTRVESSVADTDPRFGFWCFFDPWIRIPDFGSRNSNPESPISGSGSRILDPQPIFMKAYQQFFGLKYSNSKCRLTKFFFYSCSKFWEIYYYRKDKTTNFPLIFFVVVGFEIQDGKLRDAG